MRECALGDGKVLVVKDQGQVHAVGSKCTHYGAPMAKGVRRSFPTKPGAKTNPRDGPTFSHVGTSFLGFLV
jgi:nitrite reductase/ring-hydroxylating ferredoxin subunit